MAYAMTLRNGMTATGSHEYFYSLRGAQPPGEGISQKYGAGCTGEAKAPPGGAPCSPAGRIPKIGKNPEKIRFSLTNGGKRTIIYKVILSLGFPGPENSEIISERKLKYV